MQKINLWCSFCEDYTRHEAAYENPQELYALLQHSLPQYDFVENMLICWTHCTPKVEKPLKQFCTEIEQSLRLPLDRVYVLLPNRILLIYGYYSGTPISVGVLFELCAGQQFLRETSLDGLAFYCLSTPPQVDTSRAPGSLLTHLTVVCNGHCYIPPGPPLV